jgi:hypothetical protein
MVPKVEIVVSRSLTIQEHANWTMNSAYTNSAISYHCAAKDWLNNGVK